MNAKTKFIKRYGNKVEVKKWAEGVYSNHAKTSALLGRGSKTNSVMPLLETQREGIFIYGTDVDSGYYVTHLVTNESFIVTGTVPEYGTRGITATVGNLLACNSLLSVKGDRKVGDERGNLKTSFVTVVEDLPCSLIEVSSELVSSDAGLLPDTEYLVYAPRMIVAEDDQLLLSTGGEPEPFKVLASNFVTFPNMVILQVSRDIRA